MTALEHRLDDVNVPALQFVEERRERDALFGCPHSALSDHASDDELCNHRSRIRSSPHHRSNIVRFVERINKVVPYLPPVFSDFAFDDDADEDDVRLSRRKFPAKQLEENFPFC